MKACFFLQRRFVYLGHQMAILLQEKYGVKEFCGYVSLRSSLDFLQKQKDINYSQLILEEDIYARYKDEEVDPDFLRSFADKYGIPNLWPYVLLDRVLRHNLLVRAYPADESRYSHEDLMKIFQVTAKAVLKFLDEEKPDFIFFSIVSNLGSYLLYEVAKKKGIKTLWTFEARVGVLETVSESHDKHTYLDSAIEYIKQHNDEPKVRDSCEKAKVFLKTFQEKPFYFMKDSEAASKYAQSVATPLYHFRFLGSRNIWKSFCWFFKSHYDYFVNKHKDKNDYSTIKPWLEAWDKIIRKMRILRGYKDLYNKIDSKEDYAYFNLHTEPEALFPFSAPFFTDQQWVISQVARSLPLHYKLYVKDHPQMFGKRPRSYYKKLKKIPNVKIIDPSVSSLMLTQNSNIVITITGTSGWEGVLLKKPTILFGDVFYSQLSAVKVCGDITKLPFLVKEQLENFVYNKNDLLYFLSGLFMESVALDISQIWDEEGASMMDKKKEALAPLVDLIARKIGLHDASELMKIEQ